jgi:antitoxin HicB
MSFILYPAAIYYGEGVYHVRFLDLDNGFTFGDTEEEAHIMAGDVLSALLSSALEHDEPIPEPSVHTTNKELIWIAPDAKIQAALLLRRARGKRTQAEVAQAMGTTWHAYQKIERPDSNTTLVKLQKAARTLGKELVIDLR